MPSEQRTNETIRRMFLVYAHTLEGANVILPIYDRQEAKDYANNGHIVVEYARVGYLKKDVDA